MSGKKPTGKIKIDSSSKVSKTKAVDPKKVARSILGNPNNIKDLKRTKAESKNSNQNKKIDKLVAKIESYQGSSSKK
jgi:hypothetical protein